MFSGGEKKSFYELLSVIGSGIIALNIKSNKLNSCESVFVFMYANTGKKFIFLSSVAYRIPSCYKGSTDNLEAKSALSADKRI
jgi:hypothetical protein